jgi:predicted nuclease of predicted toxin-antitoxin system
MALIGHADEASFATACETRRIILTHDSDFLMISASHFTVTQAWSFY